MADSHSRLAPGEHRTKIVVWSVDDPSKIGDPRYWWDEEYVARLRERLPDTPDLAGKPKGQSLASLLRRADGDEVQWIFPSISDDSIGDDFEECRVRLSTSFLRDADPQRTYLIVMHEREPTPEQQAALQTKAPPWPKEVERIRQQWLSALAADDHEKAATLRRQLDHAFSKHGFHKPSEMSAWNAARAIEIQPGVFIQDERTEPSA